MGNERADEGGSIIRRLLDKIPGVGGATAIHVTRAMTIARPADELYAQWRELSNQPRWMSHLESVQELDGQRSRWVARLPGSDERVEWEAEITDDEPGQRLAWRTLPDAPLEHSGEVRFRQAPAGRGTELHATLDYVPPGGTLGAGVAALFEELTAELFQDQLRHFKMLMETGEIATIEGQPKGGQDNEKEEGA